MDERSNKLTKRKPAKSSQPSHEEKEAMTAELEKARLKDDRPSVQPTPLEPPHFEPPVGNFGTAAPPYEDTSSNAAAASNVYSEGYDYGDHYRGYQATCFKSTQLDNCECDARAEYCYHQAMRRPTFAPGYMGVIRCLSTTPRHMAKAIVRPTLRPKERAKRHRRSTVSNASWSPSSVPRVPPPSNFSCFSVRVS
jgi:hypothetical protein